MTFPILLLATIGTSALAVLFLHRFQRLSSLFAIVAGSSVLILHVAYLDFFTSDDAYISMRYARNWAQGIGPVWNPGERVDGYTNFLWTGFLAGASKLGLALPETAFWSGFAAAIVVIAATVQLARRWPEKGPVGMLRWLPLVVALLLAANGAFAAWAYAGLEAPLFTAFVVWAAYLHFREDDGVAGLPWSSLALLGAALTRPEGLLFFAMTAVFKAYGWLREGRPHVGAARLVSWASIFVLPYAAYFAWHWLYYGHPLPNSYYAKVGSGLNQYRRGLDYVVSFGREYGAIFALLIPLPLVTRPKRIRQTLYLATLLASWTAYVVYVGGDGLPQNRLFVPLLPILYLLGAAGGLEALQMLQQQHGNVWLWPGAAAVGLVLALAITLQPSTDAAALRLEGQAVQDREAIGRWLGASVPSDSVIALSPAGAIPYFSRLPAIDILGINDAHIAHSGVYVSEGPAGHNKFDSAYVLRRRPELIVFFNTLEPSPLCKVTDYTQGLLTYIPALDDLVHQPRLFQLYAPKSVQVGPGRWFNLLVRADVPFPPGRC